MMLSARAQQSTQRNSVSRTLHENTHKQPNVCACTSLCAQPGSLLGVPVTYSPCKLDYDFRMGCIWKLNSYATSAAWDAANGAE